jgi:hypothetical protein
MLFLVGNEFVYPIEILFLESLLFEKATPSGYEPSSGRALLRLIDRCSSPSSRAA